MKCFLFVLFLSLSLAQTVDFVQIGLGGAGSSSAARLSNNPSIKVLALESGLDRSNIMNNLTGFYVGPISNPAFSSDFSNRFIFNNHYYTQETAMGFRSLYWPAPNLAGGGPATNGNAANFPSIDDFARWGTPDWTFDNTVSYLKEIEKYGPCFTPTGCNLGVHGTAGPIDTNIYPPDDRLTLVNDSMATAFDLTFDEDMNDGTVEGIGLLVRNIRVIDGQPSRRYSFEHILKPVMNRPNLEVILGTVVLKINIEPNGQREVIYLNTATNTIEKVKARLGVIISAGTFNTPRILLNSGMGDCDELMEVGVPCVIDNPHVGKNFKDSILTSMTYLSLQPPNPPSNGSIVVGYYKSPGYAGVGTNMEVAATTLRLGPVTAILFQMTQMVHSGKGEIKLKSYNPLESPRATLNICQNPTECLALVDQFKKIRATMAPLAASGFIERTPGFTLVPSTATDSQILTYLLGVVGPEWHGVGTASIGKVVDGKGHLIRADGSIVEKVWIADLSIVPELLSTHSTSLLSMVLGNKIAAGIEEELGL